MPDEDENRSIGNNTIFIQKTKILGFNLDCPNHVPTPMTWVSPSGIRCVLQFLFMVIVEEECSRLVIFLKCVSHSCGTHVWISDISYYSSELLTCLAINDIAKNQVQKILLECCHGNCRRQNNSCFNSNYMIQIYKNITVVLIRGDPAYPLRIHLQGPYKGGQLTFDQERI